MSKRFPYGKKVFMWGEQANHLLGMQSALSFYEKPVKLIARDD